IGGRGGRAWHRTQKYGTRPSQAEPFGTLGCVRRLRRRLLAVMVPLAILSVLAAGATLWVDQQSARARIAEAELEPIRARALAAEARAARAEASLTGIAQQRAAEVAATATVVARATDPLRELERALGRLFASF